MIGLIDCNNFFVSCERVFRPETIGKPVVVMSNNDGCAVAMSNEAKALGINRGIPVFQVKQIIKDNNVITFSGNHRLYGDMSSRVMATIAAIVPDIEIYSIDECFINFGNLSADKCEQLGREIVKKVRRDVGIPTSLGIAPTKTLAKVAAHYAKRHAGFRCVCLIDNEEKRVNALTNLDLKEVWGIGRRLNKKFSQLGLLHAIDFSSLPLSKIRSITNINGERTWRELNGESCIDINIEEPDRKQICVSRSFSKSMDSIEPLRESIAYFCENAARKLRCQRGCTSTLSLFIHTNPFHPELPQHIGNATVNLDEATDDTIAITEAAIRLLHNTFRKGYIYKRAGIILTDIVNKSHVQQNLFCNPDERYRRTRLMSIVDEINSNLETHDKIHIATVSGNNRRVKQDELSPLFSTRLSDIIIVNTPAP